MRKILSLLVVSALVAGIYGNAFAAIGKTSFPAEVSFTGSSDTFGFTLKRMAGVKPAGGDVAAVKIDWAGVTVAAGSDTFKNSKVYAEVNNQIDKPGVSVYFYTDNMNDVTASTAAYKYPVAGDKTIIGAMIEKNASTAVTTGVNSLPISYRIIDPTAADYIAVTDIQNMALTATAPYGVFFVTDKSKTLGTVPGKEAAYAAAYAKIASSEGNRYGVGGDTLPQYALKANTYMFFGSNFAEARRGYSYGTNMLTVDVVQE